MVFPKPFCWLKVTRANLKSIITITKTLHRVQNAEEEKRAAEKRKGSSEAWISKVAALVLDSFLCHPWF